MIYLQQTGVQELKEGCVNIYRMVRAACKNSYVSPAAVSTRQVLPNCAEIYIVIPLKNHLLGGEAKRHWLGVRWMGECTARRVAWLRLVFLFIIVET